jgi:CheY-like chemotaxis protein
MTNSNGLIMIVEDIPAVRELIELQLQARGFGTLVARDGQEALDLLTYQRPAAIVSDILMPRVDGFSLAHRLRANPQTAMIPLIFLSATYVSQEDETFALNLGAMRFLPKPVDLEELVKALNKALQTPEGGPPSLEEREFYVGYRQRLKNKLQQKAQQIARTQQQMAAVAEPLRETYRNALAEAQEQYEEIQRELEAISRLLPPE